MCPDVWVRQALLQEGDQIQKLLIILLPHECLDGDAIRQLIGETNNWVIDEYDVLKLSVFDYSEVFDKDSFSWIDAMLPVKSVLNDLPIGIKIVKTSICILLSSSCEDANFIELS